MSFYYESKNVSDIHEAPFLCLYADEAENSSRKECFAMFLTYCSVSDHRVKTCFLGILNSNSNVCTVIHVIYSD